MELISPDFVLQGFIWLIALILSLSVHEAAHAWMAYKRGDATAKDQGRMTLDPLAHIDPIGTIVLPIIMYATSIPLFGWARPVPVYIYNLYYPTRDFMLVALAGPISNIIQGMGWLILLKIFATLFPLDFWTIFSAWHTTEPLIDPGIGWDQALLLSFGMFIYVSIWLNFILAVFNMIPIPPLDGSRVLNHYLPPRGQDFLAQIEPYGFLIIFGLIWIGILKFVLIFAYGYIFQFVMWFVGL